VKLRKRAQRFCINFTQPFAAWVFVGRETPGPTLHARSPSKNTLANGICYPLFKNDNFPHFSNLDFSPQRMPI
jgi:hypothetical protein